MMLKNDFKLNLTSLILLFGLVLLFVISLRQCSDKKDLKKAYEYRLSEFVILESNIVHDYEKEKSILRDSIRYFAKHIKESKPKKKRKAKLKAVLAPIEDKVKETPTNNPYDLAIGSYSLSGALNSEPKPYSLEERNCEDRYKGIEEENKFLVMALQESGEFDVEQQRELMALERNMEQLNIKLEQEALKSRSLKRKIWANRSIAGVSTILLILVAL